MKDFVSLNIHDGSYNLDKYLSYNNVAPTYQEYFSKMSNITEPQSYKYAIDDPRWIESMKEKMQAVQDNKTWEMVDLPDRKPPIGCKWIFKVKCKSTGDIKGSRQD